MSFIPERTLIFFADSPYLAGIQLKCVERKGLNLVGVVLSATIGIGGESAARHSGRERSERRIKLRQAIEGLIGNAVVRPILTHVSEIMVPRKNVLSKKNDGL